MPYSYPNNIPSPAKNWPAEEQKKCVKAANAVLSSGGSEQNAIFACINAAGRTQHPGGKKTMWNAIAQKFKELSELLLDNEDEKAVWTTAYINDLPDSAFLYVEPNAERKDQRHFPYKDASGKIDLPHLRNAIARIPQSNAPGLSAAKKRQLQDKARSMLENATGKKASLDERISHVRSAWHEMNRQPVDVVSNEWIKEIYDDFIIIEGKEGLSKVPYTEKDGQITFGEPIKVEIRYSEVKSGIKFYKQKDGRHRWVGWVSNHFRDNDNPREILSGKAHKDFIENVEKSKKYPDLILWHVPGSKIGKADFFDFTDDGFLISSGLFDDDKIIERLKDKELTMSHGFVRLKNDKKSMITDRYRMFEESITPEGVEANPWTRFTIPKEEEMLSERKKAFLIDILGEDRVKEIEADTDTLRKAAEAAGVDWKTVEEMDAENQTDDMPNDAQSPEPKPVSFLLNADQTENIADAIADKFGMSQLGEVITGLKEKSDHIDELATAIEEIQVQIKELKKSDDDKMVDLMTPKVTKTFPWMTQAASRREDTKVKEGDVEDDKLVESKPLFEVATEGMVSGLRRDMGGN